MDPIYVLDHRTYDSHVFFHSKEDAERALDLLNTDSADQDLDHDKNNQSKPWQIITIFPGLFFDAEWIDTNDDVRQQSTSFPTFGRFRLDWLKSKRQDQGDRVRTLKQDGATKEDLVAHIDSLNTIKSWVMKCEEELDGNN